MNTINTDNLILGSDGKWHEGPWGEICPVPKTFITDENGKLMECKDIPSPSQDQSLSLTLPVGPIVKNIVFLPKPRLGTNWKEEFKPEELVENKTGRCVRLRGLQRCANLCGLVESFPTINYIDRANGNSIMQCIYHVRFSDGTHFAGAADVNNANVDEKFKKYPTSMAESRAEARALRKALGITDMISAEEVDGSDDGQTGMKEINMTDKVEKQQVTAINALCEQVNKPILEVLTEVLGADRSKAICAIDDITSGEAIKILSSLNEQRSKMPTLPPVNATKKLDLNKKKE